MIDGLFRGIGLGLITVTWSELWFYPVDRENLAGLTAVYIAAACLLVAFLDRYPERGLAGLFVAAGLFGFVIEGVPVPILYEAVPASILWTSISWHALVSVMVGWVATSWLLRKPPAEAALWFVALGLLLGLWQSWAWPAMSDGLSDPARWPETFLPQLWIGAALWALGVAILSYPADRPSAIKGWFRIGLLLSAVAGWALAWSWSLFPVSLVWPLLMGLSVWALSRGQGGRRTYPLVPPLLSMPLVFLTPLVAWAAFTLFSGHSGDLGELLILPLLAIGGAFWAWALLRLLLRR